MKQFDKHTDFKVRYKFRTFEQGGRKNPARQGILSDFWYHHEEHKENHLFQIWPAFEDVLGNLLNEGPVYSEGIARMRIVNDEMISYHKSKIRIGVKGYFMEGSRRTADCEIIEIGKRLIP